MCVCVGVSVLMCDRVCVCVRARVHGELFCINRSSIIISDLLYLELCVCVLMCDRVYVCVCVRARVHVCMHGELFCINKSSIIISDLLYLAQCSVYWHACMLYHYYNNAVDEKSIYCTIQKYIDCIYCLVVYVHRFRS